VKKGGGILTIIAASISVIMGFITLLIGGIGSAVDGDGADQVIGMGWIGIFLSFITIGFGIGVLVSKTKFPSISVFVLSILAAIFGGTLIAIFMVLSIIGGILSLIGVNKEQNQLQNSDAS